MRANIRGTRPLDFTTDDGKRIKGTQIFVSYPKDGVNGEFVEKIFLQDGFPLPAELVPGKTFNIYCDTKGHVEFMQVVNTTVNK